MAGRTCAIAEYGIPRVTADTQGANAASVSVSHDRSQRRHFASYASWILIAVCAAVMFSTFGDYGMTGDEGIQHRYGRRLLRWYESLGADRAAVAEVDLSKYGGFFEIVAELCVGSKRNVFYRMALAACLLHGKGCFPVMAGPARLSGLHILHGKPLGIHANRKNFIMAVITLE